MSTLKDQMLNLAKLQVIDTEIYQLREEKAAKPQEIKALDAAFEEKKQGVAEAEKVSLDVQKKKKDFELELAAKEEATKKLQSQLYSLKTNKEYQTMLQQINDSKADASIIEDKILEAMDQIDKTKVGVEEAKKKLQGEEKAFNEEKKKVEAKIKEIDDRLGVLEGQRQQVLPLIEEKLLTHYERILASRDGLAIVPVKNDSCGGCNMFVPPQTINLIKMYERIITCEMCNRILYIDD